MGDVLNLRQARKAAARKAKDAAADANRVKFGLSSAVKVGARREKARADAALESHRLDRHPAADEGDAD